MGCLYTPIRVRLRITDSCGENGVSIFRGCGVTIRPQGNADLQRNYAVRNEPTDCAAVKETKKRSSGWALPSLRSTVDGYTPILTMADIY